MNWQKIANCGIIEYSSDKPEKHEKCKYFWQVWTICTGFIKYMDN